MDLIFKNFSEIKKIKFDPYDIISEAAFGDSTLDEIRNFIKQYPECKKELRDACNIVISESKSDLELKGAKLVLEALEKS